MKDMTFGEYIRDLRNKKGKRLIDIAEVLGYTQMYLSEMERDKKEPSNDTIEKMAKVYNVDELILYKLLNRLPTSFNYEWENNDDIKNLIYTVHKLSKLDDKQVAYAQIRSYANSILEQKEMG